MLYIISLIFIFSMVSSSRLPVSLYRNNDLVNPILKAAENLVDQDIVLCDELSVPLQKILIMKNVEKCQHLRHMNEMQPKETFSEKRRQWRNTIVELIVYRAVENELEHEFLRKIRF